MCKISVVTSVYNCEKYIAETIQSVQGQTYTDWEFIIIDDCSKDKSAEIIKSFDDSRIRFFQNETNRGQCNNLNFAISKAKGEYIARLDHDDICYPDRFEKQLNYMEEHPDVVLCGTWLDFLHEGEKQQKECPKIFGTKEMEFSHTFFNYCMPHSSFMIRKSAMTENNIWYENYLYAEDYHLLLDLLLIGKIDFLHESLIAYRIFPEQCTQVYSDELKAREIRELKTDYLSKIDFAQKEIFIKAYAGQLSSIKDYREFSKSLLAYAYFCGMALEIKEIQHNACAQKVYHDVCMRQKNTLALFISYFVSPLKNKVWFYSRNGIKFMIRCILHR